MIAPVAAKAKALETVRSPPAPQMLRARPSCAVRAVAAAVWAAVGAVEAVIAAS